MTEEIQIADLELVAPSALEAIERANVDIQISTARRFPRSLTVVKRRMMDLATLDEETAESCFYKLNRSGKNIEGPSIRLAEIAATSYGNLRYGARVISNDGKTITAQGFCHDLETNVLATIETRRRITDKNNRTYSEDMQVVTGNAACAIAARNSIFKVVPFAFVKPIFEAAKRTAVGDITTLADRRTKMLQKFAALGVNEKRLCESVGKAGVEEIGLSELETLIGVYGAVRDGEQTVDEAFPNNKVGNIQFGDAVPPAATTPPVEEPEKPKRQRRTKAEIEAEKQAVLPPEPEPAPDTPPEVAANHQETTDTVVRPLAKLRTMLMTEEIHEAKFQRFLITEGFIEPSDTLDKLPDEKLSEIIVSLPSIKEDMEK